MKTQKIVEKKALTKSEVLKKVAEFSTINGCELSAKQINIVLESYEKVLLTEWKDKGEFKVLAIGKLKTKLRAERIGINPMTQEKVKYPAKNVPKFTFNKPIKEFILANLKK